MAAKRKVCANDRSTFSSTGGLVPTVKPTIEVINYSITPKPIATFTLVPTVSQVVYSTPTDKTELLIPEQFIRNYFDSINNQDYQLTWSMLSKEFKDKNERVWI